MITLPFHPDVVKYVVSEYLNYDDINDLSESVKNIHLNPKRITKEKKATSANFIDIRTYVDNMHINTSLYEKNILVDVESFNLKMKKHGRQYKRGYNNYLEQIFVESYYKNGRQHGTERYWHPNGKLNYEHNWENGYKHGLQRVWNEDGELRKEYSMKYNQLIK